MSKMHSRSTRKVWQPLNRKSQVVTTIALLAITVAQVQSSLRSTQAQSSQPVQQLSGH
jgi:hypothetical protein